MIDPPKLRQMANAVRMLSVDAVEAARSGAPGLSMAAADIVTTLFVHHLKVDPSEPTWPNRDRFVLSAGHASVLLYALYHLLGYEHFTVQRLRGWRALHRAVEAEPQVWRARGVELAGGLPGQSVAVAVGLALAERILNSEFGDAIINHRTVVLASDPDLAEGISYEAAALAAEFGLATLTVILNDHRAEGTAGGTVDRPKLYEALGWNVLTIDGHDPAAIDEALSAAEASDRPTFIAARTTAGYGAPHRADTLATLTRPLGTVEAAATRAALDWQADPFEVPADLRDAWRIAGLRAAHSRREWTERRDALPVAVRAGLARRLARELPSELLPALKSLRATVLSERDPTTTLSASERVLNTVNSVVSETVGAVAGMWGSAATKTDHMATIRAGEFGGRFLQIGAREHAMASLMNGLAIAGGLIPYGGTTLVASDYARPAIRHAATLHARVIFLLRDRSLGVDEDGTGHYPVEQLASLRTVPNLVVIRPADAVEAVEAWQIALTRDGPTVIALSTLSRDATTPADAPEQLVARGAHKVFGSDAHPVVTLFASGPEVALAVRAARSLTSLDIATNAVSVPAIDLFAKADDAYRNSLLSAAPLRVAVEDGIRQSWNEIIGRDGLFIGHTAMADPLAPEDIVRTVREALGR